MNCLQKKICLFFIVSSFIVFLSVCFISCSPQNKPSQAEGIKIWHWMSDRDEALQELARKYETQTGVKVTFELYAPSDAYTQKIRAAAQTNTLPDIFGILGEKRDFASFIKAGHIYNLTDDMIRDNYAWENKLFAKALAVNEFKEGNNFNVEPGIYGVPMDVTNIQMLYNKDLLRSAGLDPDNPPRTWDEFLAANRLLKEKGIQGLVSGWGEIWMIDCFASNYAFNIMGEDKVLDTIRGNVPYTDPDWIRVFDLFRQMRDEGVLASGVVTMVNKTAEQLFANNRAAFAFNGSWCVNVYHGMDPDLDYGAMLPPRVSDNHPMVIWGGAGSSFMVNKSSANVEKAVAFLKWLTDDDQQAFLARKTNNLPSNKNSLKDIPAILAQFANDMDNTTHPNVWGVAEFPIVIETFNKGIQSIIIKEKTPESLAEEVQAMKKRELMKMK
ncbi:MAG: extracellular solute-binding protein [Candidatus Omnitrophica bacterium]|nr:extracellular solute-binding protein [Candidatus Omnitrophota bacterium]MBU1932834.1 extracellular solute-binding protein [Candidatus Omnitrophota bacterium]